MGAGVPVYGFRDKVRCRGHLYKRTAQDGVLESKHSEKVYVLHCGQELGCGGSDKRWVKYIEIDF